MIAVIYNNDNNKMVIGNIGNNAECADLVNQDRSLIIPILPRFVIWRVSIVIPIIPKCNNCSVYHGKTILKIAAKSTDNLVSNGWISN